MSYMSINTVFNNVCNDKKIEMKFSTVLPRLTVANVKNFIPWRQKF